MAITRNSAGFISKWENRTADFKDRQLKVRELLPYMYDGDTPTVCLVKGDEPNINSITGDLKLGMFHGNVAAYYNSISIGTKLPSWRVYVPYIKTYYATDKSDIKYSYLRVIDIESDLLGWVDSRAVDII